jgi:hypothetical protein
MMKYRKLDQNNDMTFGNQRADFYIDTAEGVAQAVMTRLKLWVGEWFLDVSEGTAYQQAVLGTGTRETIEPAIRTRLLDTQGVESIDRFLVKINPTTRVVSIEATISTIYGQVTVTGGI